MTINVTINNPIYVPIDDNDFETMKYYEEHGIPVRRFAPHGTYHYYAIVEGETKEKADNLSNAYAVMDRREKRSNQRHSDRDTSYNALVEDGFDAAIDDGDPAEIVADLMVVNALMQELGKMTEDKLRICQMIGEKKSEREMAKEMGIAQTTLHDRKMKVLKELEKKLK